MTTPQRLRLERRLHIPPTSIDDKEADLGLPLNRKTGNDRLQPNSSISREQHTQEITEFKKAIDFLQDTVKRLNVELSKYQTKYPGAVNADHSLLARHSEFGLHEDDPLPPWLLNSAYLSPLLLCYDERISALCTEVETYKKELENCKEKLTSILTENDQLRAQTRIVMDEKLKEVEREGLSEHEASEQLQLAEERLAILREENDILLEQQSTVQEELDKLRNENVQYHALKRQLDESKASFTSQLEELQERYKSTLQQLDLVLRQREEVLKNLRDAETAAELLQLKETELTKHNTALQEQYKLAMQEVTALSTEREHLKARVAALESKLIEQQRRDSTLLRQKEELKEANRKLLQEIEAVRKEREELFQTTLSVEKKLEESIKKERSAFKQMEESMALLEEAQLERDKAQLRDQQSQQEVQRLTEKCTSMRRDFDERLEQETNALKSQHKKQVETLCTEIKNLEIAAVDNKAQIERLLRDKKSLETELEKAKRDPEATIKRLHESIDSFHTKLLHMQSERDAALEKAEQLAVSEKRTHNQWTKDKQQLQASISELQHKLHRTENELEHCKGDRLKLLGRLEELLQDHSALKSDNESLQSKLSKEITLLSRSYEAQITDLEKQLATSIQAYKRTALELEDSLASQNNQKNKWKEETKNASLKYDKIIQTLQEDNHTLRTSLQELSVKYHSLLTECESTMESFNESQKTIHMMQNLLQESEQQCAAFREQSSAIEERESKLLEENKQLILDKNKLQHELNKLQEQYLETTGILDKTTEERNSLQVEFKQLQHTNMLLQNLLQHVKENKTKLHMQLKKLRTEINNQL